MKGEEKRGLKKVSGRRRAESGGQWREVMEGALRWVRGWEG